MGFKSFKSKVLSMGLIVGMAASLAAPVTANAAATPVVPTEPITADPNVATAAAHRAAEIAPEFLGANLTTCQTYVDTLEEALACNFLNVFGSDWNVNPDPYLWNYYYSLRGDVPLPPPVTPIVTLMTQTVGPTMADSSGVSVSTGADIYLGNAENNGYTYPSNLRTVSYNCGDLEGIIGSMYALATSMNAVPRETGSYSGRYGDPIAIAQKYEKYIKGTKLYVLSQLAANNKTQKKVAIVGAGTTTGTYKLLTSSDSSGTIASCRAAEFLEFTTTNVAATLETTLSDELKGENFSLNSVTAAQLKASGADYIFTIGVQGQSNGGITKASLQAADAIPSGATVVDELPSTVYGISMNSAENALGVGIFQSIVYSEYLNLEDAVAYFYENFYHLKDEKIDAVADDFFSGVSQYDEDKYVSPSEALTSLTGEISVVTGIQAYDNVLTAGINYYKAHYCTLSKTGLALSSNYPLGTGITCSCDNNSCDCDEGDPCCDDSTTP